VCVCNRGDAHWNPSFKTPGPDRLKYVRAAAYVITQQYSFTTFASLRFSFPQENIRRASRKYYCYITYSFLNWVSVKLRSFKLRKSGTLCANTFKFKPIYGVYRNKYNFIQYLIHTLEQCNSHNCREYCKVVQDPSEAQNVPGGLSWQQQNIANPQLPVHISVSVTHLPQNYSDHSQLHCIDAN
jgi:hypothetical protein